jgi:hypothetical protein
MPNEPLSATLLNSTLPVPVFVVVIVCAALVVPFAWDPNASDVGEKDNVEVGVVVVVVPPPPPPPPP